MLTISVLLLQFLLFFHPVSSSPLSKDESVCARTFCGAGRECVSTDRGEPVCRCLQQCDLSERWVCGSNGKSYRNHCELHRDACITQTKIHVEHRGHCLEKPTKADVSPIVCFLSDRDWMRERVIQWIQKEAEDLASNRSAGDLLQTYFQTFDDGDSQLDSNEFLRFLKHNETALNITYSDTLQTNLLLRSLCVDALIELSDENADWKLSLTEFINCLTPTYHPPERSKHAYTQAANLNLGQWTNTFRVCVIDIFIRFLFAFLRCIQLWIYPNTVYHLKTVIYWTLQSRTKSLLLGDACIDPLDTKKGTYNYTNTYLVAKYV
uniref:Follistatin-related protein 1 n=1 Tax=Oreochromis niloticus TaxID=8128 RepID=A0A669EYQ7_ORENI